MSCSNWRCSQRCPARYQTAGEIPAEEIRSFAEVVTRRNALAEVEGIGDASITQLKLIGAADRIAKGEIKRSIALSS